MGATVTGVDAVDKNVKIARLHAVRSLTLIVSLIIQITYTVTVLLCYMQLCAPFGEVIFLDTYLFELYTSVLSRLAAFRMLVQ